MRLSDLEGTLVRAVDERHIRSGVPMAEAQGVRFLCPKCFGANSGPVGTHAVLCWFAGRDVPDAMTPKPGRWAVSGTGLENLTLQPSVHLSDPAGCGWHGWVRNGDAT